MKKQLFFVVLFLLILPFRVNASSYEIITYNIDVKINEDRKIDIKEEYNIYFMEESNLIKNLYDKINIIRPDGSNINNKINVSDISVLKNGQNFDYRYQDNKIISSNINEIGNLENFVIKYSYNYGKDINNKIDEIMIPIVSNIDSKISSINFKIEFPKDFDTSKIKFLKNSTYINDTINYNINNNILTGFINTELNNNDSISMYVEFPNNYFTGATNYNQLPIYILIIPIITTIFGIVCYIKYSYKNKIKIKLNDEIPYDFNSAEIAYLYKGYLTEHDLMTIFISLASNGYIKFIEADDGYKLGTFNSFTIQKIKDYDKDNAVVKIIFEKIFQQKDMVELKDIEYNLYDTLIDAKNTIDNNDNKEKLFFKDVKIFKNILKIFIIISIILVNFNSMYLVTQKYYLIPVLIGLMILGVYLLFKNDKKILIKLIGIVILIPIIYIGIIAYKYDLQSTILYILGMILILISCYINKTIPDRTKYGNQILGEIYGFKRSLELLNNEEIKEKMSINPNYYYDMYPYIYVLDLTNMWIRKFENIIKEYPSWYITKEEFSLNNFQTFIKNMIFTITQAMFKRQLTGQSSVHVEYHKDSIKQSKLL